jgi:hypothetical protein
MSKADKLREQRAELLAKLQRERADEAGCRVEVQRQIDELQRRTEKKKRNLDALARESNETVARLDKQIAVMEADEKIAQLRVAAHDLDVHGHSPERLRIFERLCTELAAPTVNRFALKNYEARSLAFRRMKREGDAVVYRPPYRTWSELVEVNVRPGQEQAA